MVADYIGWLRKVEVMAPCLAFELSTAPPYQIHMPKGDYRPLDVRLFDDTQVDAKERKAQAKESSGIVSVKPSRLVGKDAAILEDLVELGLVRLQTRADPGSFEAVRHGGTSEFQPIVLGLTARGAEFLILASHPPRLMKAEETLTAANATTPSNLLRELRHLATLDVRKARKESK